MIRPNQVTLPAPPLPSAGRTPENPPAPETPPTSEIRQFLRLRSDGRLADGSFGGLMLAASLSIFVIVALILWVLIHDSQLSIHAFGWKFFWTSNWDPVNGSFGALPFIYGTLVSSFLALADGSPAGACCGYFCAEICPPALRGPISFLTELLAAIPSVVYGLWGLCAGPHHARPVGAGAVQVPGMDGIFYGPTSA